MILSSIQSLPLELLEKVLLQLPTTDLLFTQSVCKLWQTTVQGSPALQRALFLGKESGSLVGGHSEDTVKNPLLQHRFRGWKVHATNNDYSDLIASFIDFSSPESHCIRHPKSSWKDMFLTRQPYEYLEIFTVSGTKGWENNRDEDREFLGCNREAFHFHCDGGITMGALMQELERIYYSKPVSYWREDYEHIQWLLSFRKVCPNEEVYCQK